MDNTQYDKNWRIKGYASVFHVIDRHCDQVIPGAFTPHKKGQKLPMLWNHDHNQVLGHWHYWKEDHYGLWIEGYLNQGVQKSQEIHYLLESKSIDGLSIGYQVKKGFSGKEKFGKQAVRVLTDIELLEVSIVTFPSNNRTTVSG
jgi:HK97 family phage prohead protease